MTKKTRKVRKTRKVQKQRRSCKKGGLRRRTKRKSRKKKSYLRRRTKKQNLQGGASPTEPQIAQINKELMESLNKALQQRNYTMVNELVGMAGASRSARKDRASDGPRQTPGMIGKRLAEIRAELKKRGNEKDGRRILEPVIPLYRYVPDDDKNVLQEGKTHTMDFGGLEVMYSRAVYKLTCDDEKAYGQNVHSYLQSPTPGADNWAGSNVLGFFKYARYHDPEGKIVDAVDGSPDTAAVERGQALARERSRWEVSRSRHGLNRPIFVTTYAKPPDRRQQRLKVHIGYQEFDNIECPARGRGEVVVVSKVTGPGGKKVEKVTGVSQDGQPIKAVCMHYLYPDVTNRHDYNSSEVRRADDWMGGKCPVLPVAANLGTLMVPQNNIEINLIGTATLPGIIIHGIKEAGGEMKMLTGPVEDIPYENISFVLNEILKEMPWFGDLLNTIMNEGAGDKFYHGEGDPIQAMVDGEDGGGI